MARIRGVARSAKLLNRMWERVEEVLGELTVRQITTRIIQPGRTLMVMTHAVLAPYFGVERLA